jgi:hypothetical protein
MSSQTTHFNRFELRFRSLFNEGRGFAFNCDASGRVNLDELSERGRRNYLFAKARVGREFSTPSIRMMSTPLFS